MGNFYTDKRRRKRPLTPRKGLRESDFNNLPLHNETGYYRPSAEELHAFTRMKSEMHRQSSLERATTIIKTSAPLIASFDPTLATCYAVYRFGSYSFDFLCKVDQESKRTESYEQALINVAEREFQHNVITTLKSISIKKASEYAGKGLWMYHKEKHSMEIPEKWDKHVESALIQTFEEIGEKVF